MIRKATQIAVPIIGSAEVDIKSLTGEHEHTMNELNELLGKGWRIFSTHTVTYNSTVYLVYVLTLIKTEFKKGEEEVDSSK